MVYGEPLAVPGDFFPCTNQDSIDVKRLHRAVGTFCPWSPTEHNHRNIYMPSDLKSSVYVFVRNDAVRAPLVPPYKCPYSV